MEQLTVKAISLMTGVSAHTLRAWEKRYQAIEPRRTSTGRRYYTYQDVAKLRLLSQLVELGFSIGKIARLSEDELRELLGSHQLSQNESPKVQDSSAIESAVQAIERYDIIGLNRILREVQHHTTTHSFIMDFISPLFGHIGKLVASQEIDISHEHLMSSVIRHHVGNMLYLMQAEHSPASEDGRKTIIFSTPEGQLHEFGILISSVLAALRGFGIYYLGTNLPAGSLGIAATKTKPTLVVLGLLPGGTRDSYTSLVRFLTELNLALPPGTPVWLGGGGTEVIEITKQISKKDTPQRDWKRITSLEEFDSLLKEL